MPHLKALFFHVLDRACGGSVVRNLRPRAVRAGAREFCDEGRSVERALAAAERNMMAPGDLLDKGNPDSV